MKLLLLMFVAFRIVVVILILVFEGDFMFPATYNRFFFINTRNTLEIIVINLFWRLKILL